MRAPRRHPLVVADIKTRAIFCSTQPSAFFRSSSTVLSSPASPLPTRISDERAATGSHNENHETNILAARHPPSRPRSSRTNPTAAAHLSRSPPRQHRHLSLPRSERQGSRRRPSKACRTRLPCRKTTRASGASPPTPLEPDFYGYSFVADGVSLIRSVQFPDEAEPPESRERGARSRTGVASVGNQRRAARRDSPSLLQIRRGRRRPRFLRLHAARLRSHAPSKLYPVLYLLHGYSDDASGWTAVGRANVILDNLIAQGQSEAHAHRHAARLRRAGSAGSRTRVFARSRHLRTGTMTASATPCSPK